MTTQSKGSRIRSRRSRRKKKMRSGGSRRWFKW